MAFLAEKFTRDLPTDLPWRDPLLDKSKVNVLLTDSTDSLGLHLLRFLLDDPKVSKIFCLNRSAKGKEIQQSRFANLRLDLTRISIHLGWNSSRLIMVKVN